MTETTCVTRVQYADEITGGHDANYWIFEAAQRAVFDVLRRATGGVEVGEGINFDQSLEGGVITLRLHLTGVQATYEGPGTS